MFTILQCQKCKSGYEYYGPPLKSNPLIWCERCDCVTRATVFRLLHKDDAVFKPLDPRSETQPELPEDDSAADVPTKSQKDSLYGVREYMGRPYLPIPLLSAKQEEGFWRYVKKGGPDVCWPWKGPHDQSGYGKIYLQGKAYVVTRILWRLIHHVDPGDRQVCHKCDNPPCCNPDHVFLDTAAGNAADKAIKGRTHNRFV